MDVAGWLGSLGLGEYAPAFAENRIAADVLPALGDQDLRDLGIAALGDRKRLLAAIAALGAGPKEADAPDRAAAEGERRQVTVLFADITGFTELSATLGAEATHDVLNRYFAAADRIVEEFGGAVDKHIGDNVMAVFGAPVAHDNDPERAVRAALAIHEAARGITTPQGPLALHIGIASGQVVASGTGSDARREYTVTGDSVNLAARLQGLAGAGETLISEAVRVRVGTAFAAADLGPQDLKGIARSVRVFRIDGAEEVGGGRRATPFVGRRSELGQCRAILTQVASTGHGQAILLRGPAGIGKTRLAEAVLAAAQGAGFAVHRSLVLDFGSGKGQEAVPALVRSLLGLPAAPPKEARAEAAEAALAADACAETDRAFLNDLLDLPQPLELRRFYDAMDDATRQRGRSALVARLAAWAAARRPLLILIEDLHWADAPTLEILAAVLTIAADHRLAFLATTRPEGDPMDGAWRPLGMEQPVTTINLGPLRASEAREMAAGFGRANEDRLAECLDRAAGNPLFLEQLLQNVAESAEALVPGTIQSLVLARMDRLAPPDRRALQAASVFGQRFPLAALGHLIGDESYDCAGLLRHRLVRPEGADFLFTHALIRDGVYESMLTEPRARLHRKAAAWFAGQDVILHAEHLHKAGDPGAPRAYLEAARAEQSKYHLTQALELLRRGRELARDSGDKVALALAEGQALQDLGEVAAAGSAFAGALEAAGDDADRCRAWLGLAAVKRVTEDVAGALADVDAAQAAAGRLGLTAEASRGHYLRGNLLFPSGDVEACLREHGRALELAREAGSVELEAAALGGLADAEYLAARYRSSFARFTECVALARAHGLGKIEVANLPMVTVTAEWIGDSKRALSDAHAAVEAARRVGDPRAEMVAYDNIHFMYRARGDFARSREFGVKGIELARRLGARRFEAELLAFMGQLDHLEGRSAEGRRKAQTGLKMLRESEMGMRFMGPSMLGLIMLTAGDSAERRRAGAEAEALLRAGAVSHNHMYFRMMAIEACLEDGSHNEAERHGRALADFCAEDGLLLIEFLAARGIALARVGRGERGPEMLAEIDRLIAAGESMDQIVLLSALRSARERLAEAG